MDAPTNRLRERWLPLGGYFVLAMVSLYPMSVRPHETVALVGDSLENAYYIAWFAHQLFRAPLELFDVNVFYPVKMALTLTDHRILPALVGVPVQLLSGNPVLAYNFAVFVACLLAAEAARSLARFLGLDDLSAWIVGALYAFNTYQLNEVPRLQIIYHGFLPLMVRASLQLLLQPTARRGWRVGGYMLLLGLCANYWLLYGALLLSLLLLAGLALRPRVTVQGMSYLVLPALAAAALFSPIAIAYLVSAEVHGFHHDLPSGMDLRQYLATLPNNLLYGQLGAGIGPGIRPQFVGFATLIASLAAIPMLWWRRNRDDSKGALPTRVWVLGAGSLAAVFVLLSLGGRLEIFGHQLGTGPYAALYHWVPGFQLVRFPDRLGLIAMLFVALLAGYTSTRLRRAGGLAFALGTALAVFLPVEHLSPPAWPSMTTVPVGSKVPEVYRWLAGQPVRALAEVPAHGEFAIRIETMEMYFSAYHFKPIVHGYATFQPEVTRRIRGLLLEFPSGDALAGLREHGVDTLIVHFPPPEERSHYAHRVLYRPGFYRKVRLLERRGVLRRVASFGGPTARIPDGMDVVYRF